jgi:hypothetical protein
MLPINLTLLACIITSQTPIVDITADTDTGPHPIDQLSAVVNLSTLALAHSFCLVFFPFPFLVLGLRSRHQGHQTSKVFPPIIHVTVNLIAEIITTLSIMFVEIKSDLDREALVPSE